MHCMMFSSRPGLYPQDTSSNLPISCDNKNISMRGQIFLQEDRWKVIPSWEHLFLHSFPFLFCLMDGKSTFSYFVETYASNLQQTWLFSEIYKLFWKHIYLMRNWHQYSFWQKAVWGSISRYMLWHLMAWFLTPVAYLPTVRYLANIFFFFF